MLVGGMVAGGALAQLRQGTSRLLAAGFLAPTSDRRVSIETGLLALDEMGLEHFAFAPHLREWVESLCNEDPTTVGAEYVRLFGSGMDGALCPPMASQYLGQNLQGDPARFAADVETLMRRSGLSRREGALPPDHLVVQLELLSALCREEAAARHAGEPTGDHLDRQLQLTSSLRGWLGEFAKDVGERDRSGVFAPLAKATAAYVEHDHDLIRVISTEAVRQ